jgi:hypothetical protein
MLAVVLVQGFDVTFVILISFDFVDGMARF